MVITAGRKCGVVAAALAAAFVAVECVEAAEQRALLIGIGAYRNIPSLVGPPRDIARMEAFLSSHLGFRKDEVAILRDGRATRKAILATAEQWLVNSTRPGDRVVIYYSGHGSQVPDQNGDEADGLDETLSPVDTARNGDNQITDDDFSQLLDRLDGRDVTVIIDSCHSGTIARGDIAAPAGPQEDTVRTFIPELSATRGSFDKIAHRQEESFVKAGGSVRVWSAAAANQFSWDSPDGGVFTKHFVQGAADRYADANGNGVVSNAELLTYVRKQTAAYCQGNPQCNARGFTPELVADAATFATAIVPVSVGVSQPPSLQPPTVTVTDVVVQDNPANVAIRVLPGSALRLGQEMRVEVTSARSGWLVLLDINADNQVTQLLPNEIMDRHGKSREIRPGRPMTVPDAYYGFVFNASEPTGKGTLVAVVTEDNIDLEALIGQNKSLTPVADQQDYLATLVSRLMAIWRQDPTNRALRWSLATLDYSIDR